jgi:hypothetical protein
MKLELRSIAAPGDLGKERLVLKALSDMDVGDYAVLRSGIGDSGGPTSGRKRAYWFPDVSVKAGDTVVLYTKTGKRSKKTLDNGGTAHFFYWGSETPLWDEKHCAVLLLVSEWEYIKGQSAS